MLLAASVWCYYFECIFSLLFIFFFSSRRRHTRCLSDWSSDVCSSDLTGTCCSATKTTPHPPSPICCNNMYRSTQSPGCSPTPDLIRPSPKVSDAGCSRSEERRVGKECRSRGSQDHDESKMWLLYTSVC